MRSGAYCMRVSRSCSSHSTDIWKSASSDSTGGGSESSRARISSKLSSSTSSTSNSSGSSDGKVAAEAEAPRGLVSMPGRKKGKAGEWGARGALKAQRRPTAKVSGLSRKGPSARIPPARPPVHPPGRAAAAAASQLRGIPPDLPLPLRLTLPCLAPVLDRRLPIYTRLGSFRLTLPSRSRLATSLL
ncbi:hypothetical protein H8958_009253, partial [Nasalis larvatus]